MIYIYFHQLCFFNELRFLKLTSKVERSKLAHILQKQQQQQKTLGHVNF